MRTLEMKISDAGPSHMRVDPHVLTRVRNRLVEEGRIRKLQDIWYHRAQESPTRVSDRLKAQKAVHDQTSKRNFSTRLGQTLEIAVYRGLMGSGLEFAGGFHDLALHGDDQLYRKEEPPLLVSGHSMPGGMRFDFLAYEPIAKRIGIECKNVREWLYPDRDEIRELFLKSIAVDAVPCLIARRVPFVTFKLLRTCGTMVFQTYNQLYPSADAALAKQAADKDLLGYHDIRVGNTPNALLSAFLSQRLTGDAAEYRAKFDGYKDLMGRFAVGEIPYEEFAARVRRRHAGLPEDSDEPPEDPNESDWENEAGDDEWEV
jgi:hypothetical protein